MYAAGWDVFCHQHYGLPVSFYPLRLLLSKQFFPDKHETCVLWWRCCLARLTVRGACFVNVTIYLWQRELVYLPTFMTEGASGERCIFNSLTRNDTSSVPLAAYLHASHIHVRHSGVWRTFRNRRLVLVWAGTSLATAIGPVQRLLESRPCEGRYTMLWRIGVVWHLYRDLCSHSHKVNYEWELGNSRILRLQKMGFGLSYVFCNNKLLGTCVSVNPSVTFEGLR